VLAGCPSTIIPLERIEEYARQGLAWAWPNLLLGSIVIIPIWFIVFYLLHLAKAAATGNWS
jgi:hypothetical protein